MEELIGELGDLRDLGLSDIWFFFGGLAVTMSST